MSPEELSTYILDERNGLTKSVDVNGNRLTVSLRPTDLLVNQEIGDEHFSEAQIEMLRKKYSANAYFILSLARDGKGLLHQLESARYSDVLHTLSFGMSAHV